MCWCLSTSRADTNNSTPLSVQTSQLLWRSQTLAVRSSSVFTGCFLAKGGIPLPLTWTCMYGVYSVHCVVVSGGLLRPDGICFAVECVSGCIWFYAWILYSLTFEALISRKLKSLMTSLKSLKTANLARSSSPPDAVSLTGFLCQQQQQLWCRCRRLCCFQDIDRLKITHNTLGQKTGVVSPLRIAVLYYESYWRITRDDTLVRGGGHVGFS